MILLLYFTHCYTNRRKIYLRFTGSYCSIAVVFHCAELKNCDLEDNKKYGRRCFINEVYTFKRNAHSSVSFGVRLDI